MSEQPAVEKESFAALLEESMGSENDLVGQVIEGRVVSVDSDFALIDVGLKSEGRVLLKEFAPPGQKAEIAVGDTVEVFLERMENKSGEAVLSREKARREEAWTQLEKAFEKTERVNGVIFGRVKGGFTVDLQGAVAFLPGSQVDIRPVRDVTPLMGTPQPFQILKMDRSRGNIVVSRRAVLEESRAEQRTELIAGLKEGQVLNGVVKNITDYGAFIDLGGVDGLLHVTDIAWRRINHPSEALQIGQAIDVQVIRFNRETQRISLGMKQLEADPWEGVEAKYPVDVRFTGRVTNITDYGAFVELEPGVEGLGPCLGNELDEEKRPSGQDRVHQSGSRGHGPRYRSAEAARSAWVSSRPWTIRGTRSWRNTRSTRDGRRGQEHHRVRVVHRLAGRNRRHGPHVRSRLGEGR